jgi:thioredoxin reductase/Pyruvate/2-oxoacid:ferredoxin oxidoreductase delta subunit
MSDNLIILLVAASLIGLALMPFYLRQRRAERTTAEAQELAERYGLHEPVSLHPVVDVGACIGTGACIDACPEQDVLGLRHGQAQVVTPARCIGHGLCERVCPTEAIQLVFGTSTRGVEIPRIKQNFETNVPGLYIVGELGGMGLIRNAFEQGRQCVEGIARESKATAAGALDVVVVGCGPAGLSASLHCMHNQLRFVALEKEDIGGTVRYYPRKKVVMTGAVDVPGYGKLNLREVSKEDLIATWAEIVQRTALEVNTHETVQSIVRDADGHFTVSSTKGTYRSRRVILAIGRRGVPRKLHVPGEDLPKVIYSLLEPEAYERDQILVVGGGDSAVEAALALADQQGNRVTISYRGDRFNRVKPANLARIEDAVAKRKVDVLWKTNVVEIKPKSLVYKNGGEPVTLPNDVVAIFAGGELPLTFLRSCGVQIDKKFGEPR